MAGGWLLDLLGLPPTAAVGFVTGAMMANFTCLAAARHAVLRRAGWDVDRTVCRGAAGHRVVGEERHDTIDVALRYLGLGTARSVVVAVDEQGRVRLDALAETLDAASAGPADRLPAGGQRQQWRLRPDRRRDRPGPRVRRLGARRRRLRSVGGGVTAAAAPDRRLERADSWTTDAHKTLNVPYDSGIAIVADAGAMYDAMGVHAAYLIQDERPGPDRHRARVLPPGPRLHGLGGAAVAGRHGVAEMVEGSAPTPSGSPPGWQGSTAYRW